VHVYNSIQEKNQPDLGNDILTTTRKSSQSSNTNKKRVWEIPYGRIDED